MAHGSWGLPGRIGGFHAGPGDDMWDLTWATRSHTLPDEGLKAAHGLSLCPTTSPPSWSHRHFYNSAALMSMNVEHIWRRTAILSTLMLSETRWTFKASLPKARVTIWSKTEMALSRATSPKTKHPLTSQFSIIEPLRLKKPLRSAGPTINPTMSTSHVTQCHITTFLEHLQGQ